MGEKKWIQTAIEKPGSFTKYCKSLGFKGVTEECIRKAKRSKDPTIRKRAYLAGTLRKINKRGG